MSEVETPTPDPERIRKTISLTHRQIGATGLIGLAVALAPYLKETFLTKEDGKLVAYQIESMRSEIKDLSGALDTNTNRILKEISESEKRTVKNTDRVEGRVDAIEQAVLNKLSRTKNN